MTAFLDLTQAPYNVTQPWMGDDASAPDYTETIQLAIDNLASQNTGLIDTGGGDGGTILFPPFVVSISDKLIMRDGIKFQGNNRAASRLMMRMNFPGTTPGKHMIDLGDETTGHASFGGGIHDMHISARKGVAAAYNNYTVFSNNVQDSGAIISNCRIDGGSHFGAIKYMEGRGGASLVKFADIEAISRKQARAIGNVPMYVKVSGSCLVEIDGFEPSCDWINDDHPEYGAIPESFGLLALGGTFDIKRVHAEAVEYPIYFGEYLGGGDNSPPGPDNYCQARVSWMTGGAGNKALVWINTPQWVGKVTLDHIMLKTPSIPCSIRRYGAPNITSDVIDRIRI